MKNILIIIASLLFLFACRNKDNKDNARFADPFHIGNVEILPVNNKNPQILQTCIDSISFLLLKENDNELFQTINKLIYKGNHFYILDVWGSNSLLVFDQSGNFVRKVGARGQGPEEYVRLWDFDVDSSYIHMYDRAKMQMLRYDLEGNFKDKRKTPFRANAFKLIDNGKYLFSLVKEANPHQVVLTNGDFSVESSFISFNPGYKDNKHTDNVFQEYDGTIFFNSLMSDTIYSFSKKGGLLGGTLFNFGAKTLPEKLRNDYTESLKARKKRDYIYFLDTPFKINKFWFGKVFNGKNKASFTFNTETNEYLLFDWKPGEFNYTDIYTILYANEDFLIGWLDMEIYNAMKKKPALSPEMIKGLEEGERLLCFYHLNKNQLKK